MSCIGTLCTFASKLRMVLESPRPHHGNRPTSSIMFINEENVTTLGRKLVMQWFVSSMRPTRIEKVVLRPSQVWTRHQSIRREVYYAGGRGGTWGREAWRLSGRNGAKPGPFLARGVGLPQNLVFGIVTMEEEHLVDCSRRQVGFKRDGSRDSEYIFWRSSGRGGEEVTSAGMSGITFLLGDVGGLVQSKKHTGRADISYSDYSIR
jgi:hypothetical protein